MPPSAVQTVRDLLFWQYSKIISESAGAGKRRYPFVMDRFKRLQGGEIEWSTAIREYVKEHERPNQCIYCGSAEGLSVDHLLPRSRGGPDSADNAVLACRGCNSPNRSMGFASGSAWGGSTGAPGSRRENARSPIWPRAAGRCVGRCNAL